MKKYFLLLSMVMMVGAVSAQTLEPGMYYMAGEELIRIESQASSSSSTGFGASSGGMQVGFTTNYQTYFAGAEADVQTSTTPQFLFVYNPKAKGVMVNNNVFNFKHTSDPNLAVLLRFTQKKNKRMLDASSCDWYSIDTLIIQPIDDHQYQLRALHPLPAGEYGFFFQMPSLGNMLVPITDRVWAFSVKETE